MPSRSVVRPQAGAAWRLAAVMVGAVLLVVASVAGVNAWNAGIGLNLRFATIADALPAAGAHSGEAPARPPVPLPGTAASASPQNILILGVDGGAYSGRTGPPASSIPPRTPDAETLSSIMLVNIPATRTSVSVLSILPETQVVMSERNPVTLRQALSSAGVASVVEGVQELVGARIQHVAAVEVAAVGVMTDAVGGVDLVLSPASGAGGASHPNAERIPGSRVLSLLRGAALPKVAQPDAAQADPVADSAIRAGTEQAVVRGLLASAERKGTFKSLRATGDLAEDLARFIAVDEGLTVGYLSSLQLKLDDLDSAVEFRTLPATAVSPGAKAAVPDATALAAVQQALASDSLAEHFERITPTG